MRRVWELTVGTGERSVRTCEGRFCPDPTAAMDAVCPAGGVELVGYPRLPDDG